MRLSNLSLLALAALTLAGCDQKSVAYGDANSIIAVMSPELWAQVSEDVYGALEQTIQTVREEKTFTVTYQDPGAEEWGNLRRFRQMLLVGTDADPWIAQALATAREPVDGPGMSQVYDVWSRGQNVTVVLLSEAEALDEIRGYLPEIRALLDEQFRQYARSRMFMTGPDTALADTLMAEAGFSLLLPVVYKWAQNDSVYVFRNDNPDPSELIRQIAVTWRSPVPPDVTADGILAWRSEMVQGYYSQPQAVELENLTSRAFTQGGNDALEVQAIWTNPPELPWPAAGPFITRAVTCSAQDRVYLVDAWLFAPGKEKYEYMIQLETILDSFQCGTS